MEGFNILRFALSLRISLRLFRYAFHYLVTNETVGIVEEVIFLHLKNIIDK